MAINLSEGSIAMISNGETEGVDLNPVCQIADLKLVNTQNQNAERYRLLLSDGKHLQQGMLTTQKNDLVRSGKLQKGSIVQLKQFLCNVFQGRMIIIIIDLDVILERCDPIGEPKQYDRSATNTISPSAENPTISVIDLMESVIGMGSGVQPSKLSGDQRNQTLLNEYASLHKKIDKLMSYHETAETRRLADKAEVDRKLTFIMAQIPNCDMPPNNQSMSPTTLPSNIELLTLDHEEEGGKMKLCLKVKIF